MEKPKSLAVAWDVQRRNRPAQPAVSGPVRRLESLGEDKPSSVVDAIFAKRKAALEPVEDLSLESDIELPLEEDSNPDIAEAPEPLPFPTSRADSIRMKLKALRGE